MPKTVTINVTQEDIDQGLMCAPYRCPISLAIKRTLKIDYVSVGGSGGVWVKRCDCGSCPHKAKLPSEAYDFMCRFDSMGCSAVKPLVFDLTIPDNVL